MKKVFAVLGIIMFLGVIEIGLEEEETKAKQIDNKPKQEEQVKKKTIESFEVGTPLRISTNDGDYEFVINSIATTKERSRVADVNPSEVVEINYTYSNIDYKHNLVVSEVDLVVTDEEGEILRRYPVASNKMPQFTPEGTKCNSVLTYALLNDSDGIKVKIKEGGKIIGECTARLN